MEQDEYGVFAMVESGENFSLNLSSANITEYAMLHAWEFIFIRCHQLNTVIALRGWFSLFEKIITRPPFTR